MHSVLAVSGEAAVRYDKLVRSGIPHIIRARGGSPITHVAPPEEYCASLREKLSEEVREYLESGSLEELADICEVVDALAELAGHTFEDVLEAKRIKQYARGTFSDRIILEEA